MQLIYILLLLNSLLKASISSDPQNSNDKIVKNKGRLSRVTWLLHENENDNLNHRMFEDDEDKTKEKTNNKMHYKKRKYNVKVEHKRKESILRNLSKKGGSISNRKEIAVPKYLNIEDKRNHHVLKEEPNELDVKVNKNKLNKAKNNNKDRKTFPKDPKAKEKTSFHNRNYIEDKRIETDTNSILKNLRKDYIESKKVIAKDNIVMFNKNPRRHGKQDNEVHRKPKNVYLKKAENPNIMAREEPRMLLHSKMDPNINIRNIDEKNRENILKLMGLNFASLANPPKQMQVKLPKVHDDDINFIADKLAKKVRVLCWVMTHPGNHNRTCKPIKATWGKRCNKLLFMSTEYDSEIPTVKLEVKEGRDFLWPKTKAAFKYIYDNYYKQYDWFVRADDDTFLVVENLRYLLADFDPQEPIYFGCRFKHFSPQGFMSGGASIPLSVGALERFVDATKDGSDICKVSIDDDLSTDDVNLGICLSRIGVKAMDSRDVAHKGRFLVFMPQDHMSPTRMASAKSFWYWKYVYYPTEVGEGCCSDYAISFHYVSPDDMYALDYLIYRIRPFGIQHGDGPVPKILGEVSTQNKTANNRKIRTEVTDFSLASTSYGGDTEYEQSVEAEADVTTTELNEISENGTTVVSKTTHSDLYEQVNEGFVPIGKVTSVNMEDEVILENGVGKNTIKDTVNSKPEYEEVTTDDKEELVVKNNPKKRSSSTIQRSVQQSDDINNN